jgi:hypothetical protein
LLAGELGNFLSHAIAQTAKFLSEKQFHKRSPPFLTPLRQRFFAPPFVDWRQSHNDLFDIRRFILPCFEVDLQDGEMF